MAPWRVPLGLVLVLVIADALDDLWLRAGLPGGIDRATAAS
jgi:hypothetical protein